MWPKTKFIINIKGSLPEYECKYFWAQKKKSRRDSLYMKLGISVAKEDLKPSLWGIRDTIYLVELQSSLLIWFLLRVKSDSHANVQLLSAVIINVYTIKQSRKTDLYKLWTEFWVQNLLKVHLHVITRILRKTLKWWVVNGLGGWSWRSLEARGKLLLRVWGWDGMGGCGGTGTTQGHLSHTSCNIKIKLQKKNIPKQVSQNPSHGCISLIRLWEILTHFPKLSMFTLIICLYKKSY